MEIKIKRGLDLKIAGGVTDTAPVAVKARTVAIYPDDFEGFIPKTDVKADDKVAAGDAVLHHKSDPRIKLVSPVAGTVVAVERGERRHIDRIIIEPDGTEDARKFDVAAATTAEGVVNLLAEAGILALMRQRPYAIIPDCDVRPRDIFVTAFDSAPLATDRTWTAADANALAAAAEALAKVTTGKVYISRRADSTIPVPAVATEVVVSGPHPAGLPGIQAANIAPVSKGETIWTLSAETLLRIGRLLLNGTIDATTLVTVAGPRVANPYVALTTVGADAESLLAGHLDDSDKHLRVISGNVLTGTRINATDGYIHYPYTMLTVIDEGDDKDEFMGWASISPAKMSVSPSYPGKFLRKLFRPDARLNGGRRAIIMSGEYDRVLPMDILAEYLIKAIQSNDIESMERLGIYEVAPEDFAVAEYVDSSKQPLQNIVRQGLDYLRKELM